jgi:insulysin
MLRTTPGLHQAMDCMLTHLPPAGRYTIDEQAAALPRITAASLQAFLDTDAFASGRMEGLIVGNVDKDTALAVADAARRVFAARGTTPARASDFDRWRAVALEPATAVRVAMAARSAAEPNSAHLTLWQGDRQADVRYEVLVELAALVLKRPAFHQLRTVEQIGYLVWSYATTRAGVPHLAFLLQSTEVSADGIGGRVHAFLRQWRGTFEARALLELTQRNVPQRVPVLPRRQNVST